MNSFRHFQNTQCPYHNVITGKAMKLSPPWHALSRRSGISTRTKTTKRASSVAWNRGTMNDKPAPLICCLQQWTWTTLLDRPDGARKCSLRVPSRLLTNERNHAWRDGKWVNHAPRDLIEASIVPQHHTLLKYLLFIQMTKRSREEYTLFLFYQRKILSE